MSKFKGLNENARKMLLRHKETRLQVISVVLMKQKNMAITILRTIVNCARS